MLYELKIVAYDEEEATTSSSTYIRRCKERTILCVSDIKRMDTAAVWAVLQLIDLNLPEGE